MEDYAAKMQLKTDAALREYVTGYQQYREAAVLAAFEELRRRGQPAPEEAGLRPALEVAAEKQRVADEAAEAERLREAALTTRPAYVPAEEDEEEAEATGPALYSRASILLFSTLTMLAGGVLLGLNLARLKQWKGLAMLGLFVVLYLLGCLAFLSWALPRYGFSPFYKLVFDLPAVLVYLLWFWPRYIGLNQHRGRSWLPPLVLCLLALWSLSRINAYLMQRQPKEVQQQMEKMMPK